MPAGLTRRSASFSAGVAPPRPRLLRDHEPEGRDGQQRRERHGDLKHDLLLSLRLSRPLFFLGLLSAIVGIAAPAGDATASKKRPTVAGLICAAKRILPPLARLEAGLQRVPRGSVLTGEGRLRPAADLGSWARSRGYRSVSPELGDALAEGSAPDDTTREWTRCHERGNGAAVICPDGYIEVNQQTRPDAQCGDGRGQGRRHPASGARVDLDL